MHDTHFASLFPKDSRSREITEILSSVVVGESCQLVGIPGAGREDVLELLAHNREVREYHLGQRHASFHFVIINMAEVKGKPFHDVVKFIFYALASSLQERQMSRQYGEVAAFLEKGIVANDVIVLRQGLKDAVSFLGNKDGISIVFLLHRFEEYAVNLSAELFVLLDSLSTLAEGRFSAVFSLHRPLEQIVEPKEYELIAPFLGGQIVFLSLYDGPSLAHRRQFIEQQMGRHFQEAMLIDLVELTGGHRKMMKRGIEEILREDKLFVTKNEMEAFLLESKGIRSISYEIWGSLLPAEQRLLKSLIRTPGKPEVKSDDERNALLFLQHIGVIVNNFFVIAFFEDFVRYRTEHASDEHLLYQEETGEIFRGEQMITDAFTAYEYRFLQLLLKNPGQTIERDEVIHAVWNEQKATEGVTDQALDQLVFRLRGKVEENPHKPRHLQTVKGRGFVYYH